MTAAASQAIIKSRSGKGWILLGRYPDTGVEELIYLCHYTPGVLVKKCTFSPLHAQRVLLVIKFCIDMQDALRL